MKFRRNIGPEVIGEVREKVARLKLPKSQSVRTILIHSTGSPFGSPHGIR
ncbi:MAG: hypothetical protein WEB53_13265 [Akkermansiaceae bacterium]